MFDLSFWKDLGNSRLLLNPRLGSDTVLEIEKTLESIIRPGYIYLQTSGTTQKNQNSYKIVELSKKAMLTSAESVNTWINSDDKDVWVKSLPEFHVGGLSIFSRASLNGARVVDNNSRWNPQAYCDFVKESSGTITSLVPTQLFDLVEEGLKSPASLRVCFVGGGSLSKELRVRAQTLGWPVLETYGMTEFCSQVATESLDQLGIEIPKIEVLPHIDFRIEDGELHIKGKSGLSRYLEVFEGDVSIQEFDQNDWFKTKDRASLSGGRKLEIYGRINRVVKISGELVNLSRIEGMAKDFFSHSRLVVLPLEDERKGNRLILVADRQLDQKEVVRFNKEVLPFERLSGILEVDDIAMTELGKPVYSLILESLIQVQNKIVEV